MWQTQGEAPLTKLEIELIKGVVAYRGRKSEVRKVNYMILSPSFVNCSFFGFLGTTYRLWKHLGCVMIMSGKVLYLYIYI